MKRTWNRMRVVTVGALLLVGSSAWAQRKEQPKPREQGQTCTTECKSDTPECIEMCSKYSKKAEDVCAKACRQVEQECVRDCKGGKGN
jgi:hypothetical protein